MPAAQLRRGDMHAVGADLPREGRVRIDENPGAVDMRPDDDFPGEGFERRCREAFLAYLDQLQACAQPRLQAREERAGAELARARYGVFRGQLQAAQDRPVGGKQRIQRDRLRMLPLESVVLQGARPAAPGKYAVEVKA